MMAKEQKTVRERIDRVIAEELQIDRDLIKPEARFAEDLEADSLDVVTIIIALEQTFEIDIADEEAVRAEHTVADLYEMMRKKGIE
jgi:acyl carrier protein